MLVVGILGLTAYAVYGTEAAAKNQPKGVMSVAKRAFGYLGGLLFGVCVISFTISLTTACAKFLLLIAVIYALLRQTSLIPRCIRETVDSGIACATQKLSII